jgi:hypothetical protein
MFGVDKRVQHLLSEMDNAVSFTVPAPRGVGGPPPAAAPARPTEVFTATSRRLWAFEAPPSPPAIAPAGAPTPLDSARLAHVS